MLLASLFLFVGGVMAQETIKGAVISADDGEPLPGASVKILGEKTGTITNIDGEFTIEVPNENTRLEFSHIGMKSRIIRARNGMRIALDSDNQLLDEVMVVAYGTQKKSSFTGAASTIKADKIEGLQVSSISKALEGQVAGVQIASSSGTPGSDASIIVRGIGSISSSQSPLIVLDGVPYEGSLNSIPSHDIENLTILKDAAANSMYGARGANGVIIITTKNAKRGEVKVNFDARWGYNDRAVDDYDIIRNSGDYYEMMYEAYRNQLATTMGYAAANAYAAQHLIDENLKYNNLRGVADNAIINPLTGRLTDAARNAELLWDDDWTKDPFRKGFRQEYNANVTGGTDKTQVYFSAGYLGDKGYMVGSDFNRTSARVKVNQEIGDYIKVGGNIGYSRTNMERFSDDVSNNYSNIFMFGQSIAPIYPIYMYDAQGNVMYDDKGDKRYDWGTEKARPYASEQNPLASAERGLHKRVRDNITSRGFFEAKFLKDFTFTANIAYDVFNTHETDYMTPIGGDALNVGGRGYKYAYKTGALNVNQILEWNHKFGDHGVRLLLVHENKQDNNEMLYGHMTQFADPDIAEFSNAAEYQNLNSYTDEYSLEGYLAKAEYDFKDRYYMTASIRRDGSSRFHKDNRWGTFWAVGGAWRINEEPFMKGLKWINNLKLKASYGTQGNDDIPVTIAYTDQYIVERVDGTAAFSKAFRGNKDLTWEKQSMFNVGLEASLWNRLTFGVEFFVKNNKDMLFQSPLPPSAGNPTYIYRNEVDMRNTGIEFELGYDIIKNSTVHWNVALNLSHYKNELTRLPSSKPDELWPDGFQRGGYWWKKGGSVYNFAGYEYLGVDPATGKPQYAHYDKVKDANGFDTNQIDYSTRTIVNTSAEATVVDLDKSAIPDITGGLSTTVEFFGFDISIQTAFQLGGYVQDSYYSALMNSGSKGTNFHKDMFERWTPAHTDTNIPALCYENQNAGIDGTSDFFLTKANYFSLRNVTIGYTFPKAWTKKVGINKARIYATGDNIWLKSKRQGLDPRQSFSGGTGYVYSALSSYSLGVNVSF